MRIVILNTCKPYDEFAQRTLSGLTALLAESAEFISTVDLNGKRIADCTGCFRCWTHTPGADRAQILRGDRAVRIYRIPPERYGH